MMEKVCYIWRVYLLPKSGWKALILLPALFLAGLWGFYLGGILLLILAIFLLLYSLRDFLFPLHYQLDPVGIKIKGLFLKKQLRWDDVEEIKKEGDVFLLYPRGSFSSSRLKKPFYLYIEGNEEEVWRKIESYWKKSS
jgi:hypothetical protein